MKAKKNKDEWSPEPFPEPRTIPALWNASAFEEMKAADQKTLEDDWKPEPFPEPRMFFWGKDRSKK